MKRFIRWLFSSRNERERRRFRQTRQILIHDIILFMLLFIAAVTLCNSLSYIYDDNNQFSIPIFILVVALVARFTQGYVFGVLASLLGVLCVNYMYTYPYWEFDMSITGYPLTFAAMLMVSICIGTLTSRIKRADQIRMEAEMEKMRANLLRSVSHDLRTPLTSIVGSSSVLLEDSALTQEERSELLREINKDARWLTRITENMLSVTKFSDGHVRLHKEFEVIEEIVSSAIVKFKANHSDIQIRVVKPEEFLLAPMDATLIEQVLLNLFDNAVVHGKKTTALKISIQPIDDNISICVSDNGCGIDEHVFPHLFDGLASNFKHHSDERRNMGIGLSVCCSIISAHGGSIRANNNPDGGARFEILLPADEEETNE